MNDNISSFLKEIDYKFKDKSFLVNLTKALTHPSLKIGYSYQKLEFLGDKVLSLIIAEILYVKYPNKSEGDLSKILSSLVNGRTISKVANKLGIGNMILMSSDQDLQEEKQNSRILEDVLEAIIGAIYLDSGFIVCKKIIKDIWGDLLNKDVNGEQDPISLLQEIIQKKTKKLPLYQIIKSGGSDHKPIFKAEVTIGGKKYIAIGSSKKEAQKKVADKALIGSLTITV